MYCSTCCHIAQLAVVALLGFLEHGQVLLQVVLGRPGGAVDALQHLVAVVAAPVGTGHLHQLEVLEPTRGGHVRAAAQVLEGAFAVQRDVLAGRDAGDDLRLVVLAESLEEGHRLVTRQHAAFDPLVALAELDHLGLDREQVLRREGTLVGEVVVEAVLDHRPDRHLRIGEQLLHRIGEQVRRRVADDFQPVGILVRQDGQRGVGLDAVAGVHHAGGIALSHATGDRGLGQARTDRRSHLGDRHRPGKPATRAVGQLN
jgi:hypothetical protein